MSSTRICRTVVIAAIIASGIVGGGQASASAPPAGNERHCVIEVSGVDDGVFVTQPEVCFGSQTEAVVHIASINAEQTGQGGLTQSSGSNTIGTHYTSTSYSGSSVRIVGTTCSGGVWYPTGVWNNNIESSRHHCGSSPTNFYDSSACSGSPHSIYSAEPSLGQMNNRASCVRYG